MPLVRLLVALVLLSGAAKADGLTVVSEGAYGPEGSHVFIVHSAGLGRDFKVVVSAPSGPLVAAGRKLPAIYALDGGRDIAGPVGQYMSWSVSMSPAYVVEIGYPEKGGDTAARWRNTDLLFRPTDVEGQVGGGGAAAFQAFLTDELRPLLEARYPLDPKAAVLFGHSFGALFAANVLARAPASYASYIIASPSVWADPSVPAALAAAAPRLGAVKVFLAVGGAEEPRMATGVDQIAAALAAPGSAAKVERRTFAGQTHGGYYPELVPQAYAWVLPLSASRTQARTAITLTAQDLQRVAGVYDLGDGRKITVTVEAGQLFAEMTGSPGGQMLAESHDRFFASAGGGFDITLTFEGPPDAPPTAAVLSINGAESRATRAR
jgi:predicted alpha/beta superfamily hydrolase